MRGLSFFVLLSAVVFSSSVPLAAQPTIGTVHRLDPALDALIPQDAEIEVLAQGFTWAEGPVWVGSEQDGYLLFSDIPRNTVFRWEEGEGITVFLHPSGYTGHTYYGGEPGSNGLLLDPQGRLVLCEHGDRRVSVLTKNGGRRTLVDHYQGRRLNSPNDACFHRNGDLYFTDPPYGLPERMGDPRQELDFCGVYRLSTDGTLTLLTKEMTRPNGIAFSPDCRTLYVAQSDPAAAVWKAFPVKPDGTLGPSRVLYDATGDVGKLPGLPDGLKVDRHGHLFATGPGGVLILSPEGRLLGRLDTGKATANCGWGDDGRTLYITADSHLCRIRTTTRGAGWTDE